jgi:hypothetical protein
LAGNSAGLEILRSLRKRWFLRTKKLICIKYSETEWTIGHGTHNSSQDFSVTFILQSHTSSFEYQSKRKGKQAAVGFPQNVWVNALKHPTVIRTGLTVLCSSVYEYKNPTAPKQIFVRPEKINYTKNCLDILISISIGEF